MKNLYPYEEFTLNEGLFGLGGDDREAKRLLSIIKSGDASIESERESKDYDSSGSSHSTTWKIEVSPETAKSKDVKQYYVLSLNKAKMMGLPEMYIVSLRRKQGPRDPNTDTVRANKGILEDFIKELGGIYDPRKLRAAD